MKKELIVDAIGFIHPIAGLATKYLFNIVGIPNEKLLNKQSEKVNLSKLELKFINYILNISSQKEEELGSIEISCNEIMKKLKVNENDFNDIRYSLESYRFLSMELGMGYCSCRLNYSLFWKSDYLELITNKSLNFEYLLKAIVDYLYLEKRYSTQEINPSLVRVYKSLQ